MKGLVLLTFFLGWFTPQVFADQASPIKVGVILPLTGDAASLGDAVRNGMMLAFEKLSPALQQQMKIIYEDDAMLPRNSVSAFSKLTSVDKVDVIVAVASTPSKVVASLAEKMKIPMLAIASDFEVVAERKYVVSLWVTPKEEAKLLVPEALRRGYRTIARISTIHDGTLATKKAFDQANKGQMEVVIDEEYPIEIKDFRPFLTKARARKDLDAILPNLYVGQVGLFAKQAREMGIELPLFNFESFEDPNEVRVSGNALVGQWYVQADDPTSDFKKIYGNRFPESNLILAPNAHDIILLIAEAVKMSTDRDQMNVYFHTVKNFKGALGVYSATGDNRFTLPAVLKIVTDKGFEKLG